MGPVLMRAVGMLVVTALAVVMANEADAQGPVDSRVEVVPGVYLASFSEDGPAADGLRRESPQPDAIEPDRDPRVVGGHKTAISRWPWQVSIGYVPIDPSNDFRNHHCGGSLVTPQIVVTAAHCVTLGQGEFARTPEEFRVIAGRTRLSSRGGGRYALADYFWFVDEAGDPLWNRETIAWDVVFLLLSTPSAQETIKIAGEDEAAVWSPGQRAFATGWGSTKAGTDGELKDTHSDVLRQAKIKMIPDSGCGSVYGPILLPDLMVCAGVRAGGIDVCTGDSGGPLVVPIAGGGYRLVGDTSFAAGCGLPRVPGVYGRLAAYPIRQALREGIRAVSGSDVVGSGARPPNRFNLARQTLNYSRRGTDLVARVPGPGQLRLRRNKKLRGSVVYPREAGTARIRLVARAKAQRRLAGVEPGQDARATVTARITYTPLNGNPRTTSNRIRIVRRR